MNLNLSPIKQEEVKEDKQTGGLGGGIFGFLMGNGRSSEVPDRNKSPS